MDYMEFFKEIKSNIKGSYVFFGEEEYIKERAEEALIEAVLSGGDKSFNMQILGEDSELLSVNDAVNTLPFMCPKRLVIWKNPKLLRSEMSEESLNDFKDILQGIKDSACLLIYITGNTDKRRKVFKMLTKESTVVEFKPLDEAGAARWLITAAKRKGKTLSPAVAEGIVMAVGSSVMDLNNELEKLCADLGDKTNIERSDLSVLSGGNIAFNAFEMINCFLKGNSKKGMSEMYRLLKSGESAFLLLGAISSKLRKYYQAKILLKAGKSRQEVIDALGGGYSAKYTIDECSRLSFEQIKKGIDSLCYADYAVKNGRFTEEAAVEYVIAQMFLS